MKQKKSCMKTTIITIICLLSFATAQAQNAKEARIKEIRTAYANAKKKIEQNGKHGKSPKDMSIVINNVVDEEAEIYEFTDRSYYFDEAEEKDSNGNPEKVKRPYFIIENWECHGHIRYSESLINPRNNMLMFYYTRGETDAGFVVESRYYYDKSGKCIEHKHNTPNSWTDDDSVKEQFDHYIRVFKMLTNNDYDEPLDVSRPTKKTTPKAQRIKHIRDLYAQAKKRMAENDKADARRDIYITIHDQGDDMPPRTQEISLYFDTVKDQVEPDAYSIDNYCYFISEHSKSMSYDGYMEFLFEPKTNDLVFSYTRAREEGEEHEWRYYYDENGKCIETKSNSEETDEGFYDKRAAKDYVAIMKYLLEE